MYEIKQERQLEILRWLLGMQEGQWLVRASAVYGAGESLKLSAKVRAAQAKTEMKAMLTLIGKQKADNLADAAEIIKTFLLLAFGERSWSGNFRLINSEASNGGLGRMEIEALRCPPLDNIKKIGQASPDAIRPVCEGLWSGWFEALLPDLEIEVTAQFAGTNGRTNDTYVVTAFDQALVAMLPEIPNLPEIAAPEAPSAEISPIAAALQIPIEQIVPGTTNQPPTANSSAMAFPDSLQPPANNWPQVDNNRVVPGSGLAQRLAQKRPNNEPTETVPVAKPEPVSPPTNLTPAVFYDTKENRPLFSRNEEQKIKEDMDRRKRKNPMLMQRMFLSKQAREMLAESADQNPMQEFNLASGIENILQQLVARERTVNPGAINGEIHVLGSEHGILIQVSGRVYEAVDDVPPGRMRELLQQAVAQWNETQT